MSLNLTNSVDIICNSLKIIENGQLVDRDTKIASGSTIDIPSLIIDNTFRKLNTLNNYMLTTDINTALSSKVDNSHVLENSFLFAIHDL